MPPNFDNAPFQGTLKFKYPKNRDASWKTGDTWLDGKRNDDGAEGLWRVHDNLYDVAQFIDKHPGGRMWLELTKGTDITEAFECHHLSTKPEKILQTYFVRTANTPRNSPFTFEEDGLFRTLKRRLIPILETVPKSAARLSNITTDLLCLGTFVFAVLAAGFWSYTIGAIAGLFLCATVIASHNYFHQKDNFRMYYFDLSLMNFREWRITHALSHHLFPNTIIDFEVSFLEPLFVFLPKRKSRLTKYASWPLALLLWMNLFLLSFLKRIYQVIYHKETQQLLWSNVISIALPLTMYLFTRQSLIASMAMWLYILSCGSFVFSLIGFTAAHHHPEIFHDGDSPRSYDKYDWGQYQLDAVADRVNVQRSRFLVLTTFGEHGLHHIFPAIDHGALRYLRREFEKVLTEFKTGLKVKTEIEMIKGQFMQLAKDTPSSKLPRFR